MLQRKIDRAVLPDQLIFCNTTGQMTSVIYALLKKDQELLSHLASGAEPPEPQLYDPELHRQHRMGQYQSSPSGGKSPQLIQLSSH
jgi:hypothetical protein